MTDVLTNASTPTTATEPATKVPDFNFKEIVTAAIALAIVATLIGLLWMGFERKTLGNDEKYIIGIALSLAGTVTGYYFGRVPAEKRAETAEKAEGAAKEGKAKAEAQVSDAKRTLENVLSGPPDSSPGSPTLKAQSASGDPVRLELEALRRRLS